MDLHWFACSRRGKRNRRDSIESRLIWCRLRTSTSRPWVAGAGQGQEQGGGQGRRLARALLVKSMTEIWNENIIGNLLCLQIVARNASKPSKIMNARTIHAWIYIFNQAVYIYANRSCRSVCCWAHGYALQLCLQRTLPPAGFLSSLYTAHSTRATRLECAAIK